VNFHAASIVMGGADRIPPGPKGRGPLLKKISSSCRMAVFTCRAILLRNLCMVSIKLSSLSLCITDSTYSGGALNNPFTLPDNVKGPVAAAVSQNSLYFLRSVNISVYNLKNSLSSSLVALFLCLHSLSKSSAVIEIVLAMS
jgi:hypothetical protein